MILWLTRHDQRECREINYYYVESRSDDVMIHDIVPPALIFNDDPYPALSRYAPSCGVNDNLATSWLQLPYAY